MDFDLLSIESCLVEDPNSINPTTCSPTGAGGSGGSGGDGGGVIPPSDDDRCADPAFADANPDICAGYPRLILKPEYALTESGKNVQYSTFVRTGGSEQQVTLGLNYKMANPDIAVIEALAGKATGIQSGITTVSVAWQNLTAFAQIEVVASCAALNSNFVLLIDDSNSMKVGFDSTYSNRLNFAKEASNQFIDSVMFPRDKVAVMKFDTAGVQIQGFTTGSSVAKNAVNSVVATLNKTSLYDGLKKAIDAANAASGTRVIVLFSDGENNTGDDPVTLAKDFRDSGGFIIVMATRASGIAFDTLYKIASAGFFLSAYGATALDAIDTLINLKSYLCSGGDCSPPVPGTFPKAALDYDGFINWNVFQGSVDLCGLGTGSPEGLYDLLPGNGLYVDLSGTKILDGVTHLTEGGLESKTIFNFISGHSYTFRLSVAGNQRIDTGDNESVRIRIGTYLDETITPADWNEPFTVHSFNFTAGSTGTGTIKIEMIEIKKNNVGPFIDNVYLADTTASVAFLDDDFDDENPTLFPPVLNYYGGCMSAPIGPQLPDPSPPSIFTEGTVISHHH